MWNIAIQPAVGCYNSWANLRCSGCYPQGEKLLWNRSIQIWVSIGSVYAGFPQKSQKKVPWLFHDFSMPKSKFPDTKYQHILREYLFLRLIYQFIESITNICIDINSYPLFASMDTGIYPCAALQYHAWPKAKCDIPYPRKQRRGNELIPCSNDVAHILKHLHSYKTTAIPFIPNHCINTVLLSHIAAARELDGCGDHHCDVINHVPFSL